MLKRIVLFISIIFLVTSLSIAQESLSKKLKELKGDVQKITITIDGKEHKFEGDEAKQLFKRMKSPPLTMSQMFTEKMKDSTKKKIKILMDDDEFNWEGDFDVLVPNNHFRFRSMPHCCHQPRARFFNEPEDEFECHQHGNKEITIKKKRIDDDEFESIKDKVKKDVKVEVKDGKKTVTIKTLKDGKEEVKVYEGNEADEFLKKMKEEENVDVKILREQDKSKGKKKIIIMEEKEEQ